MNATNPLFRGTTWMGVCYAPYHQANVSFGSYTENDVSADMAIIAKHYRFIRTYTVQYANQFNVKQAYQRDIQVALGAWIFPGDSAKTKQEIDTALKQVQQYPDTVKCLVVGNEVDLADNHYTVSEVRQAMQYAKSERNRYPNVVHLPVTTCLTGTGPTNPTWSPLLDECRMGDNVTSYVFLTIYPWWAPDTPDPKDISANMQWSYDNGMRQAEAKGLTVVIAEIGWPSAGRDDKKTTPANELTNYQTTCAWINGQNFLKKPYVTFWFEMFDEPWKTAEGGQGPHWGLYGSGKTPQPKFPIPPCA